MSKILDDFESYLFLYKNFSVNTYLAYKKDVLEFLNFLADNNIIFQDLKSQDFINFFNSLKNKNMSFSCVNRKASALKVFVKYLKEKHNYPDFLQVLDLDFEFAIFCNRQKVSQVLQSFKNKNLTNLELRNYLILYLLYVSKTNVNQLINIKISDICYQSQTIFLAYKKRIILPIDCFDVLKRYVASMYINSIFLFPVKVSNLVKPISKQAVWNILRLFFNDFDKKTINYSLTGTNKIDIDPDVLRIYQKMHPRD